MDGFWWGGEGRRGSVSGSGSVSGCECECECEWVEGREVVGM